MLVERKSDYRNLSKTCTVILVSTTWYILFWQRYPLPLSSHQRENAHSRCQAWLIIAIFIFPEVNSCAVRGKDVRWFQLCPWFKTTDNVIAGWHHARLGELVTIRLAIRETAWMHRWGYRTFNPFIVHLQDRHKGGWGFPLIRG